LVTLGIWFGLLYLLYLNFRHTVLMFSSPWLNHGSVLVLCLLGSLPLFVTFHFPRLWMRIVAFLTVVVILVPIELGYFFLGVLPLSQYENVERFSSLHPEINVYYRRADTLSDDMVYVQHQRSLVPGVLMIRDLWKGYLIHDVQLLDSSTVFIEGTGRRGEEPETRIVQLKPNVWF